MTRKERRQYIMKLRIASFAAKLGVFAGAILLAGGVGSIDFAVEIGEVLTKWQEMQAYTTSAVGILIAILCICVVNWCDNVVDDMLQR